MICTPEVRNAAANSRRPGPAPSPICTRRTVCHTKSTSQVLLPMFRAGRVWDAGPSGVLAVFPKPRHRFRQRCLEIRRIHAENGAQPFVRYK